MKLTCMRRLICIMTALMALGSVSLLSSCDSAIYDDEVDCTVHYRVSFRYTKNILNADAFGSQVTNVNLYLFDKKGNLVLQKTQKRAVTTDNDFYMDVDVLPGRYDMLAWCEGESIIDDAISFVIDDYESPSSLGKTGATLPLQGGQGALYSNHDINRFYHGIATNVDFPDSYGIVYIDPIFLTKDTNHITIQLQNVGEEEIDPNVISITLEGQNNKMNYLNELVGNTTFMYEPWSLKGVTASSETGTVTKASVISNGVIAELTTGRIMADRKQRLVVRRTDTGETIFSIPLVEYLLLVRGEYEQATSNQDYLDRYDDFTMVFFLQDGYTWLKTRVLINGWRRVPPQDTEL